MVRFKEVSYRDFSVVFRGTGGGTQKMLTNPAYEQTKYLFHLETSIGQPLLSYKTLKIECFDEKLG